MGQWLAWPGAGQQTCAFVQHAVYALLDVHAPPAEREIKYKSEKKHWEEQQKELAARLAALGSEVEAYRGTSKSQQFEDRIQVGCWPCTHALLVRRT